MMECLFCKIIDGGIPSTKVYEDDNFVAFNDIYPKADVHVLVVPKRHIVSLAEVTEADAGLMAEMMVLIPKIATDVLKLNTGFRTIFNTGRDGGQEIDHIHAHILGGKGRLPGF